MQFPRNSSEYSSLHFFIDRGLFFYRSFATNLFPPNNLRKIPIGVAISFRRRHNSLIEEDTFFRTVFQTIQIFGKGKTWSTICRHRIPLASVYHWGILSMYFWNYTEGTRNLCFQKSTPYLKQEHLLVSG